MEHTHHVEYTSPGPTCRISMLWNLTTIDTCFLASHWHVHTPAEFAVTCISVLLLVMLLEGLRRTGKAYDRSIVRGFEKRSAAPNSSAASASADEDGGKGWSAPRGTQAAAGSVLRRRFRPSAVQQAARTLFHALQFAVAYVVMLLAMGANGYIVFCIFAGAYGKFVILSWETALSREWN
ncbi:hypothetical protein W97_03220 [Coniosporium apollinis CBS 100218]|uniref:Copper transport protein n=1 Tax=Coniosporium apollinis (strain CBS 100218) TaxID=1168221 RepID=R7YPZ6_CONA1|nr:uncharacterized protein W97_03220 [Coniosporium apollinis CBS 100218]EON63990.1 hypothetical protein W97_03220 [Coniosporium apollinis CBS 100218]